MKPLHRISACVRKFKLLWSFANAWTGTTGIPDPMDMGYYESLLEEMHRITYCMSCIIRTMYDENEEILSPRLRDQVNKLTEVIMGSTLFWGVRDTKFVEDKLPHGLRRVYQHE